MNATNFKNLLAKLGACESAKTWAKSKSLQEVWDTCERGDWLLWLSGRMSGKKGWPNRKAVVLAACAVAKTALKHVPAGEVRPLVAIQTARRWATGRATIAEVRKAVNAAFYAANAANADAAKAAASDASDANAANAAAFTAYAAFYAASNANTAAYDASLRESADIVRRHLTIQEGK